MEMCVESFDGEKYTIDVGVDDTTADIRRKVASAAELCEDGFDISFGGKAMAEGDDTTQLSAGDTVVLTKTKSEKDDAIAALRDLGEILTAERFKGLTDLKLIHLFLQAEVVTEIHQEFLAYRTFEELDLSGVSGATKISSMVLLGCAFLHTADLSGWSNVTHVESGFLYSCTSLTTLDISGWHNVTQIGYYFLSNCSALRTVDLSGWGNVMRVEDDFLSKCTSLTALDLSAWSNVSQIGCTFLSRCESLTTLDLSGWTSIEHIGRGFLKGSHIPADSINVSGSGRVVSEYVHIHDMEENRCQCVCI